MILLQVSFIRHLQFLKVILTYAKQVAPKYPDMFIYNSIQFHGAFLAVLARESLQESAMYSDNFLIRIF